MSKTTQTAHEILVNPSEVARACACDRNTASKVLKRLKPKAIYKYGRGDMRLYEKDQAEAAVRKYLDRHKKPAPESKPLAPKEQPSPLISLSGIEKELEELRAIVKTCTEKLTMQNQVLLHAVEHMRDELATINKELGIEKVEQSDRTPAWIERVSA